MALTDMLAKIIYDGLVWKDMDSFACEDTAQNVLDFLKERLYDGESMLRSEYKDQEDSMGYIDPDSATEIAIDFMRVVLGEQRSDDDAV